MVQIPPAHWASEAVFYHIYPLGFCGVLNRNDFHSAPSEKLQKVVDWIPHLLDLGVNALYLGPVFESTFHGYDTADYYQMDRRLGSNQTLAQVCRSLHDAGIRVILDGVFNHVGRDFWAFRDVLQNGAASSYCDWFDGLDFRGVSPYGDPFSYQGWSGNFDLVKLNLDNPAVREHLFNAIKQWVDEFGIDGLRLDAADCLDLNFLADLHQFTRELKHDFWLVGEIVAGDYRRWANPEMLDSVTNYECYKGLYSSLADKNYFEIAWSLNRQFGAAGLYRGLPLYNFADNHDVNRVASSLTTPAHLYPLYCLLFTMPGVPSIYYGSEWGLTGMRTQTEDAMLRPNLDLASLSAHSPQPDLPGVIGRLSRLRLNSTALKRGSYTQLTVAHEQLSFLREDGEERIIVALNAAAQEVIMNIPLPCPAASALDLLNSGETFQTEGGKLSLTIPAYWCRVLKLN